LITIAILATVLAWIAGVADGLQAVEGEMIAARVSSSQPSLALAWQRNSEAPATGVIETSPLR